MSARWKYLITLIALALVLGGIAVISGPSQADIIVQNGASQPIARIWVTYPGGDTVLSESLARGAERHVAIEVGEATYSLEIRIDLISLHRWRSCNDGPFERGSA